jgi:single-stranded-DNA-specific exonuclease
VTDTAAEAAVLGVTRSLTGRRWRQRGGDGLHGLAIAQRLNLPEMIGRVLAARGVDPDGVERHLSPTLRDWLPDPYRLADMERAAERIADAVGRGERIAILGDYDVDGATATALLTRYLAPLGVPVSIHIPDRRTEGYGPNAAALLRLQAEGASLAITVDCGTLAFEPLAAAAAAGLDVVVLDHHMAEPVLPPAFAVVNPNRLDDRSGERALSAAGVTFLALVAVNRILRERGAFRGIPAPDLMQLLDLVALGTVCDVMPLTGLNRAFVAQGIKIMALRRNPGLVALADGAGVAERLDAYHLGYVLGPRVNAGGRVGRSDLGARLLATDDPVEARRLAEELERHNGERREIESEVLAQAILQVEAPDRQPGAVVIAHGTGWHQGVVGIVAGRLKERYNRPACVIAFEGGIGRGSGRSVPGLDLGAAIIAARQAGLLTAGGGHRMAAGFSLAAERLDAFAAFLSDRFGGATESPEPELGIDGLVQPAGCTAELCATLDRLGPFGSGNSEPRFALAQTRIARSDIVGAGHVRCFVTQPGTAARLKAIAFRAMETPLGAALLATGGTPLHLAGHLRADTWQGRDDVQLIIDDGAPLA